MNSKVKFILSKNKVLEQYNKVAHAADIVSYSSKTNQIVTRILEKETNCMFSVHFKNELKHVTDLSRVIFLAQGWNTQEITELIDKGIKWFIVDNETDLNVLEIFLENNSNNEVKINVLLRLKLKENTLRTERYYVFGMTSDVINKKVVELRNNTKIGQLGIHFHRKTQNMAEWNYVYELENVLTQETLQAIDLLNIGGGLPSEYANTNIHVVDGIFTKINECREWLQRHNIKLIIEPGRFIAAPAGKLITKIVAIHDNTIIVNASVYNSDMDALIVPVKLLVENEVSKEEGYPYVIKGITPCSMDLFRYRVYLNNPEVGDELVFLNAGAYNFTTDFCDLDKIETEVIE
ncbi:decarboxylase [Candidatus Woesearchaeota archaeon]|jgi:ornithine decarboxylase|nr:decarboxylase [Candidatus Woesearchaeota archaeon]MBT5396900.1 decarboxylase [Candidatus Woesearchaeota archaeon]MBT5924950.1 decarboxylase [Candidatus Woesearchaeota archaeon]MBT6367093.1 decarboxylase [Candidatus Woesearchaeota archaeon]MBT7762333.1 decarboxylase [Candidatus Woesearchaeota archaeon]